MENLAFHSLLRWYMIILSILTTSPIFLFEKVRRMYFLNSGVKVLTSVITSYQTTGLNSSFWAVAARGDRTAKKRISAVPLVTLLVIISMKGIILEKLSTECPRLSSMVKLLSLQRPSECHFSPTPGYTLLHRAVISILSQRLLHKMTNSRRFW